MHKKPIFAVTSDHLRISKPPFQLGPWRVEPEAGFIVSDTRSVRLEPKVMAALAALAAAPGQVVSRTALFDQIWPGQVVSDDALTTVISTLRKHLGDDSRRSRIETVPKRGYRLVEPVRDLQQADSRAHPAQETGADGPTATPGNRRAGVSPWLAGLLAAVVVLAVLVWWRTPPSPPTWEAEPGSIAVLPFKTLGDSAQLRYFADGLAEELIHQLSADPLLKVTSRTSSFKFQSDDPVQSIAQALNVQNLLEGSVRGDENRLRVTVQLVDTENDQHLWSRVFDVEHGDLLLMQEKVSNEVVALISGSREATMLQTRLRHPVPNEAYRLYLLGQSHMRVATVQAYEKAASYFADALRIAPDYPIALTQYAAIRLFLHQYRNDDLAEATAAATEALERALAADPDLAEAQAVLGLMYTYNSDYDAAELAFQKALAQRPNMSFALHNYAFMLWRQGRTADVLPPIRTAIEIDPISGSAHFLYADSLAALGRFEASIDAYVVCNEMIPDSVSCLLGQSAVERMLGRLDQAETLADAAARLVDEDYLYLLMTRMGLSLYRADYADAGALQQRVADLAPAENFSLRVLLLLAQQAGNTAGFLQHLDEQRSALTTTGLSTAGLDWVETHAQYWLNDCDRVLDHYETLGVTAEGLADSAWGEEFGHSHLVNLLHCQRQTGRRLAGDPAATAKRLVLENAASITHPAGLYLLARIHHFDGKNDLVRAALTQLEQQNWPFLFLAEADPLLTKTSE